MNRETQISTGTTRGPNYEAQPLSGIPQHINHETQLLTGITHHPRPQTKTSKACQATTHGAIGFTHWQLVQLRPMPAALRSLENHGKRLRLPTW